MSTRRDASGQWQRSVALAARWIAACEARIAAYPVHSDRSREAYFEYLRTWWGEPVPHRAHAQVHVFGLIKHRRLWAMGETWQLAIAARNTARYLQGDIALCIGTNGFGRQPFWCSTSKGARMVGCYESTDLYFRSGTMHWLGCPDELVNLSPADPAIAEYVLGLRAGSAVAR